jgi:phosphoenolpyruvate carboxylase
VIGYRACIPAWFGWSNAIQITIQDLRIQACARVTGPADPFNCHIDEFRIVHVQRSDGWIATTWNNMSDPGASQRREPRSRKAASRHRSPALGWSSV